MLEIIQNIENKQRNVFKRELQMCSMIQRLEKKFCKLLDQMQKILSNNPKKNVFKNNEKKSTKKKRDRKYYKCGHRSHEAKTCPNANTRTIVKSSASKDQVAIHGSSRLSKVNLLKNGS